jgi:pilus assembly protein Flp/PilA
MNVNRKEVVWMNVHKLQIGQGLVEYAMLIVLVAIFVLILIYVFGTGVGSLFSNIVKGV